MVRWALRRTTAQRYLPSLLLAVALAGAFDVVIARLPAGRGLRAAAAVDSIAPAARQIEVDTCPAVTGHLSTQLRRIPLTL